MSMRVDLLLERVGTVLEDRYELGSLIGTGASSYCFDAFDPRTGRTVAVKVLDPTNPTAADTRREAEARASRVHHPSVATAIDVGEQNGVSYLVFERFVGETLADRLSNGPMPVENGCETIAQLLSALDAVHSAGLVHADVKPGNVFLARCPGCAPALKLLDFGCSSQLGVSGRVRGHVLGTPAYMAPEQLRGETWLDARTDVYSAGITLFEVLSGRRPHAPESYEALLLARVNVDVRRALPSVPRAVTTVIAKAIATEPGERYTSAAAMQLAVLAAIGRSPPEETAAQAVTLAQPRVFHYDDGPTPTVLMARRPYAFDDGATPTRLLDDARNPKPGSERTPRPT